jgi:lysine biosynthesis protein LysW
MTIQHLRPITGGLFMSDLFTKHTTVPWRKRGPEGPAKPYRPWNIEDYALSERAKCPECGKMNGFSGVEQGQIVACEHCHQNMEVRTINPLTLWPAAPESDDWGE